MFTKKDLLDYSQSQSFWASFNEAKYVEKFYERSSYIGEKMLLLYKRFDLLASNFPKETKVIFIRRNPFEVASSQDYKVAVSDWKDAERQLKLFADKLDILEINYDELFKSDYDNSVFCISRITDFLGVPEFSQSPLLECEARFFSRKTLNQINLSDEEIDYIEKNVEVSFQ
ncbi:sulfotransferase [Shewanella phaeophyticola]|uniref:Sulfotransferase n=1 Tax=Shewanella phaeophyticola TaxID=2978345 RepID=A0ABT2NZD8_9GAMM|nr:sulfotransferase [Shewanella sp. KJ10-1]MCT8985743.1 sulfotransferase [Shewanella sp. KJ10-1]